MNCSCINDMENKLSEKYSVELSAPARAECLSAGFSIGASIRVIHKTEFKITADAAGFKRGKSIPIIAAFCPFCGTSTKEQAA